MIALPKALEQLGYRPGAQVFVEQLASGALVILPAAQVRDRIRDIARQVIAEDQQALALLEAYDRGEIPG